MSFTIDWSTTYMTIRLNDLKAIGTIDVYIDDKEIWLWDVDHWGYSVLNYAQLGELISDLRNIREMIAPITPEDPDHYGEGPDYPY